MSEEKRPLMPPEIARIVAVAERIYISSQGMVSDGEGGADWTGPNVSVCIEDAKKLIEHLDLWRSNQTKEWEEWYKAESEKLKQK